MGVLASIPTILDASDRRARRNAATDLIDQAQKFDFARDTTQGRESTEQPKGAAQKEGGVSRGGGGTD